MFGKSMSIAERILRNKCMRTIIKYMYIVSAWYMRRRSVTKGFLFFTFFILPLLLYAYIEAQPFINQVSNVTSLVQNKTFVPSYAHIRCENLFPGRLFVAGPFSYTTCYYINETHALFSTGLHYGVIEFIYNETRGDCYAVSIVHESMVNNISARYLVLVAIAGDKEVALTLLRDAIEERGLGEKICESFLPSTSFGGRYIHYDLYTYFCDKYQRSSIRQ